jgi:large subunit ribosomal protein L2
LFKEPSFYFSVKKNYLSFSDQIFLNSSFLFTLSLGSYLKNVEKFPLKNPIFSQALGSICSLKRQFSNYSLIELPSKNVILLSSFNLCTPCSDFQTNTLKNVISFSKKNAGFSRRKGIRPTVKGRAKNPVDHPNGGRTGPGGISRNP